jgi:hypothetical protein
LRGHQLLPRRRCSRRTGRLPRPLACLRTLCRRRVRSSTPSCLRGATAAGTGCCGIGVTASVAARVKNQRTCSHAGLTLFSAELEVEVSCAGRAGSNPCPVAAEPAPRGRWRVQANWCLTPRCQTPLRRQGTTSALWRHSRHLRRRV